MRSDSFKLNKVNSKEDDKVYDTFRSLSMDKPSHVDYLPQVSCMSCRRVMPRQKVIDLVKKEGLTEEQALNVAGLSRICCRRTIMADNVISLSGGFNPEAMRGMKSTLKPGEVGTKWYGHMKIYEEKRDTEEDEIDEGPDESWKDKIPHGYRFLKWLTIPGVLGRPDTYTMQIVKTGEAKYSTSVARTKR